jgi:hypothetical protein
MNLDIKKMEPVQFNLFLECLRQIKKENPVMIEVACGKPEYSFLFDSFFKSKCKSICTDIRKKTIESAKLFHPNGIYYCGFSGERVYICEGTSDIENNPPKISLNDIFKENGLTEIDIFHVDAQGSELSILKELQDNDLIRNIKTFFVSIHSESLHRECVDLFSKLENGKFIFSSPVDGGYGDGLIVYERY